MHPARKWSLAAGALAAAAVSAVALAQAPGIKRTLLQRTDLQGHEAKECVLGAAEIAPGGAAGKHIHHGIELEIGSFLSNQAHLVLLLRIRCAFRFNR